MFKKEKTIKETIKETFTNKTDKKEVLVKFLKAKMPTMFNRDPDIVGDVNKFAEDILELIK